MILRLTAPAATGTLAAAAAQLAGRPQLPSFLAAVQGPLDHYGLWAIGLLLLLENIGVPVIPGELAMIAGAIYAGAGQLNIVAVGVVSFAAAVIGATIGYAIGRFAGRALVLRYGRYALIREHHLEKAEQTVDKYGGIVVVVARFIVGLRELNGIICGVSGMNPVTFIDVQPARRCRLARHLGQRRLLRRGPHRGDLQRRDQIRAVRDHRGRRAAPGVDRRPAAAPPAAPRRRAAGGGAKGADRS